MNYGTMVSYHSTLEDPDDFRGQERQGLQYALGLLQAESCHRNAAFAE
jgi:hypothetical protein